MNILNGTEAFAAMMAGRNILCRAIGELIEFDDIDQFPATIFAKPGYEFCIKIETMELAGIPFTKPLTLDDVRDGQDVYTVNTYGPSIYISEFGKMTCTALIDSINSGFAQRDAENAKLQLQAMSKVLGRELTGECLVVRLGGDKPKRRSTAKKADTSIQAAANDASVSVEKKTFESQSNTQITEQDPITAVEESLIEEFVETDAVKLVEKFTAQINEAETVDAVIQIRYQLNANGHMVRGQIIELNKLGEKRIQALTPSPVIECDLAAGSDESQGLSVDELKRLQEEAEKLIQPAADSTKKTVQADEDVVHQELLADLLDRVAKAASPAEANAQIKYTKSWTPEQRTPLISAINKRLVELNPSKAQPSLAVRIQRAEDLTELDGLEIDVSACDEEIQPRLMELVEKRRLELDPFTAAIGEP